MRTHAARVGLAEFEIQNEFGVYRLYASGYGRPRTEVAAVGSELAASVLLDLLRRGGEDARSVKVAPIDGSPAILEGPVDARRWAGSGTPMPTLAI